MHFDRVVALYDLENLIFSFQQRLHTTNYFILLFRMLIPVQTIVEKMGPDILTVRDDKGHTPAQWACLGGHTTILRYLLENKAPVNEPSNNELGA